MVRRHRAPLVQAIGQSLIRVGVTVRHRSIFDVERDFLHEEAMPGMEKVLNRYFKPDLLMSDAVGHEATSLAGAA